jgi:hypothetical protein
MKRWFPTSPRPDNAFSDVRQAKRIALLTLRTDGLRLHLVWAALICLVLGGGGLYLMENVFAVVPWVKLYYDAPLAFYALDALYTALDIGYIILLVCPLLYGAMSVFYAAADGRQLPLSCLFDAFSCSKSYGRTILIMTAKILPRALAVTLLVTLCRAALGAQSLIGALLWYLLALVVLVGAALVLGLDDALLPLALKHETVGPLKLYRASLSLCAPRLWHVARFKLSFLLWGLASVASLGVLLFSHALPYFCLAHAAWADTHYAE